MIKVKKFTFNPFQENTYIISNEKKECIIIDPGCSNLNEEKEINFYIENSNLSPKYLLNTHCHIDHILGNNFIKSNWDVKFGIHKLENELLKNSKIIANNYGIENFKESPKPDFFIEENQVIEIFKLKFKTISCPGHSPGHILFYEEKKEIMFSGDLIFKNSIGRYDLPGSDYQTLCNSIRKVCLIEKNVKIHSGHGPITTLDIEKKMNPFILQIHQ